jgi:exopolyphosphatase/guanosine-5'-triphosphate,3'-diphosphate pyrophosphatase
MSALPSGAQPVAVISMGSNDLHLLVATSDGASTFTVQADHSLMVELAASLDGRLLPAAALGNALDATNTLMQVVHATHATAVWVLATEALREASNGPALLSLLEATFGLRAVVLSGQQEAALDYCWAGFPLAAGTPNGNDVDAPRLVIDSGGGSTQVAVGAGPAPTWSTSMPIGAGSLTAQLIAHDPPKSKEMQAVAAHVAALVDALPRVEATASAVAMGGSADHLLQVMPHPRRGLLSRSELEAALEMLHQRPAAKVARDCAMSPERARLLPAGATILARLMQHYALETAAVKPHGIRGAFTVCYARAGDRWLQTLPLAGSDLPRPAPRTQRKAGHG